MRIKLIVLAALLLPTLGVCGDIQSLTIGDLSSVQSETIMFEAKAKRAEAKAKMQENLAKAGDDVQQSQPTGAVPVIAAELPTVTGISGAAGRLFATFQYPNGTTISSKSGERIPGGYLVAEIGIDRVVLTRGDRRIPLQFGTASAANPSQPSSMQMMPPSLPGAMAAPIPLR